MFDESQAFLVKPEQTGRRAESGEAAVRELQDQLFEAMRAGNDEEVGAIKERYENEFKGQLEGVETLFGLREFLLSQREMEKTRYENAGKRRRAFQDLTEYQFLFTHFVLTSNQDKRLLGDFWAVAKEVAQAIGADQELRSLRCGLVTQVAVSRILEEIGENPQLSHPREDAFNAVDVWADDNTAVQIKGWRENEPALIESDEFVFPATEVAGKTGSRVFNSNANMAAKNHIFRARVDEYGRETGRDLEARMMVIPYSQVDFDTGEPAPELVDFFREKLKES